MVIYHYVLKIAYYETHEICPLYFSKNKIKKGNVIQAQTSREEHA